jgi:hypothetical protein
VVTVSGATATLSNLKNSNSNVNAENYTFANNVLTLKSVYLATQTNGEKTFTLSVVVGDGDIVDFVITVTVGD